MSGFKIYEDYHGFLITNTRSFMYGFNHTCSFIFFRWFCVWCEWWSVWVIISNKMSLRWCLARELIRFRKQSQWKANIHRDVDVLKNSHKYLVKAQPQPQPQYKCLARHGNHQKKAQVSLLLWSTLSIHCLLAAKFNFKIQDSPSTLTLSFNLQTQHQTSKLNIKLQNSTSSCKTQLHTLKLNFNLHNLTSTFKTQLQS